MSNTKRGHPFIDLKEKFVRITHEMASKFRKKLSLETTRKTLRVLTDQFKNQKSLALEYLWVTFPDIILG
jgi:hypothetical protein